MFRYGLDVKVTSTLSLLVSLPTILVGLWPTCDWSSRAIWTELTRLVVPMGGGSIAGALVGGCSSRWSRVARCKRYLAWSLITSALRVFSAR
jgi:hypothetical protein